MSQKATNYNNANATTRTTLLRDAKIEEAGISEHVKQPFESLPPEVQQKLENAA